MSVEKTIALIGADGMLASMLKNTVPAGYRIVPFDLPAFDLTDTAQVAQVLGDLAPQVILNCAALTNVDGCESQPELAMQVNGTGAGNLAAAAKATGAVLVHISTDFVFDGSKRTPYVETDPTGPLSVYGVSKLEGERQIRESGLEGYFIVRTSWLYGPGGNNFVETILRLAAEREQLKIVADQVGTPTYTGDLATGIWALLASDAFGLYHFSNLGQCSWYDFAGEIIDQHLSLGASLKVQEVLPIPTEGYPLPAVRPAYSVLSKEKVQQVTGLQIPAWQDSLHRYLQQR